ncbi:Antibiotic biosynthesis monooxygenase [Saccharopolyspora antimicrobica]|uniref:Antibiotic biosynthesis monooxygenase n=1 Tax=Saccharopolyspora antimicrobica TaxID=455193 RepID=A0A1I5IDC9_9PSEU|nr:antibiotic biosynthesis monooxygenase [Saccharopolyspora antimicrobica]RKT85520.1 antibiotic biosynthesis monooxygenase [Saccharopolyspora antimicrobica]SFO58607.1 Antibiotic biosynthesis monooxygenase [Saccharopolyspora antimicrobica]
MKPDHIVLPEITRTDVGTILVSPWLVGTPERQRAAVDATIAEWKAAPWPEAFLSLNCFVSLDGETVLNYAQWTDDEAHREFVRTYRPTLVRGIDEVVPGIERPGLVRYRLRGSVIADGPGGEVVAVFVSDADGPEHAERLVAEAQARLGTPPDLPPGLRAAHFHVSTDGSRVLVYEEWADKRSAATSPNHEQKAAAGNLYRLRRSLTRHHL